jgi:hypothetical protein
MFHPLYYNRAACAPAIRTVFRLYIRTVPACTNVQVSLSDLCSLRQRFLASYGPLTLTNDPEIQFFAHRNVPRPAIFVPSAKVGYNGTLS